MLGGKDGWLELIAIQPQWGRSTPQAPRTWYANDRAQVRQTAPPGLVKSKSKSSQEGCSGDQTKNKTPTGVQLTGPRLPSATNEAPSLIPIQAARCWNGIPARRSRLKTVLVRTYSGLFATGSEIHETGVSWNLYAEQEVRYKSTSTAPKRLLM
ncbi:hypothetical protein TWF569_001199 [Orbilia oligospora]|uniref:Uncharacterized protein n=1 Tax=Orbilia oligospora TaxID=2813651 RepID=A0A7C8N9I5_ORBOL|nr:hypothetical protein TWF103_006443 [Orbilia oligospora]KAF3079227.1 hypothetical protein TWF706_011998 [Orbilia oligospora]KAF3091440.1 hypothetical protein TWF102_008733 [Orbilia oligospora]KAF3124765.1 hypothetical protein TWF569_001199 [Orbilia oligospora]KAF3148901.1 hypothetical protein TWF594_000354 [Orbilia oligospora]